MKTKRYLFWSLKNATYFFTAILILLFISGSLPTFGQTIASKLEDGNIFKPEAKIVHVFARDGEYLVIQYGSEEIVRLGPGRYERDKKRIIYSLTVGRGLLLEQIEEKNYFLGVLVDTNTQRFLRKDKAQIEEKQYRYFLTVSDKLRHFVLKIYVNANSWQYYSIQRQKDGLGFYIVRAIDPEIKAFFEDWNPEDPQKTSTHPDNEDIYFEIAVADSDLYGCNGRTYLPFVDLSKYLYMKSSSRNLNSKPPLRH